MPFFERAGQPTLHYELDDYTDPWKKAPYILLQHGYARSSLFWRACVPYLGRFYKVLRPDLRGLGKSSRDFDVARGISIDIYLQDLVALLDHLGIERVHYCGESSAGTLGMAFAAKHPDRVRTLSLVSAPVFMTEEDKKSSLGGFPDRVTALKTLGARGWLEASNAGRRFPADADPGLLAWTLDEMGRSDTDVLVAMFNCVSNVNATELLPRIKAPVLGLYPDQGVIVTDEHTELLRTRVPNARVVRVPTKAHSLQVVKPATVATEVLYFVSQHDGITCRE